MLRCEYFFIYIVEGSVLNVEFINWVYEIECNIDFEVVFVWCCIVYSKLKVVSIDGWLFFFVLKVRGDVIFMLKEEELEKSGYFLWMW